ncbi:MAG: ribosomal protein S18-alanine N-acetyltransferase [Anaerolineae bacterium]
MDYTDLPFVVERMELRDIEQVCQIEQVSFPTPWPSSAYRYELRRGDVAHYFVARPQGAYIAQVLPFETGKEKGLLRQIGRWLSSSTPDERPPIVGYGGFWLAVDEAHISTLAVRPDQRRKGIGELLLVTLIDHALAVRARFLTLEVRESNEAAQHLYRKYRFQEAGRRLRYYSNKEDALIMSTEPLTSPAFQDNLARRKERLRRRLKAMMG